MAVKCWDFKCFLGGFIKNCSHLSFYSAPQNQRLWKSIISGAFYRIFFCLNLCLFSILRVEASFLFLYHDNKKGLKLSFIAVYNNRQQFFFRCFSSFWWDSVICCAVFIGHARLLEFTHCAFHFILAQTVEYSKYRPALQAMVLCAQVAEGLVCSMQPCKHAHLLCTSSFASSCIWSFSSTQSRLVCVGPLRTDPAENLWCETGHFWKEWPKHDGKMVWDMPEKPKPPPKLARIKNDANFFRGFAFFLFSEPDSLLLVSQEEKFVLHTVALHINLKYVLDRPARSLPCTVKGKDGQGF